MPINNSISFTLTRTLAYRLKRSSGSLRIIRRATITILIIIALRVITRTSREKIMVVSTI